MYITHNNKGFTLVEMIVVMAVFMFVIIISTTSFENILKQSSKIFKSEETTVESIIGLELLRHDIQQAGYGLFWQASGVAYNADETVGDVQKQYNDGPNGPPRAIVTDSFKDDEAKYLPGTDYLVVKATSVATNAASQKWSYLEKTDYDDEDTILSSGKLKEWDNKVDNFVNKDNIIVLQRTTSNNDSNVILVTNNASTDFNYTNLKNGIDVPPAESALMTAYGVANDKVLRMPFNRADYFVRKPAIAEMPDICSKNNKVGVLYKATVNHADGKLTEIPLLDCVADMQIVLGWDLLAGDCNEGNDGQVDTWSNATRTAANLVTIKDSASSCSAGASAIEVDAVMKDPKKLRESLKIIKVYILAQQSGRDINYTGADKILVGDDQEKSLVREYVFDDDMKSYRWKVHRIVARPMNLIANQ